MGTYGVVIDSSMMVNVLTTDLHETGSIEFTFVLERVVTSRASSSFLVWVPFGASYANKTSWA